MYCGEFVELSGHGAAVQSVSWRSDGCTLASTSKDKQLRVFDVRAASVVQVVSYYCTKMLTVNNNHFMAKSSFKPKFHGSSFLM